MPLTHVIRVRFSYPLHTTLKIRYLQKESTKTGTISLLVDLFINGKTKCSVFAKHFVRNLALLTQNKMCILLQKNRGSLFGCLFYFRFEPPEHVNRRVKRRILPVFSYHLDHCLYMTFAVYYFDAFIQDQSAFRVDLVV